MIYGVYDIVARIETETMQQLKDVVALKIRCLDKVGATMTLICLEPGGGG